MTTRHIIGTILLVLIALLSINVPPHKVIWRKNLIISQVLFGLGILAISILHPIGKGYRIFGFQLVFVFPLFYFAWNNNRDYHKLIRQIVNSIIIAGTLFYLGTYALAFKGKLAVWENRCAGVMSNATCFSLVGMELFLGALYLLASERPVWLRTIICGTSFGMGIGIVILGQSRIAILGIILCSIVTAFFCLFHLKRRVSAKMIVHLAVICLLALIMIEATMPMVTINNRAIEKKIQAEMAAVEETQATPEAVITESIQQDENSGPDTSDRVDSATDRLLPTPGSDIDTYTSGRIFIWKNYLRKLNWLGNDFDEYDAVEMTGDPSNKYAHNIFLEIAYRCGVPVGIIAMIFYIIEGCVCIGFLFRKTENKPDYLLFPIISCIAFALVALLDVAVMPFFQAEALLYYISVALAVDKELK